MKKEPDVQKNKKKIKIIAIILAILVFFILSTLIVTPLVIIKPSHNEEAYSELTLIELEELMAESRPLNIPLVEDVSITTSQGKLSGWVLHHSANTYNGNYDMLIYFGGRDEDSSSCTLRFLNQMSEGYFPNTDIAVIDWPGYGLSEGHATENSMKSSALSVCNYFRAQKNVSDIYVCGYSLGCGPATFAASKTDVKGLILVAPYHSAYDLYNRYTPCFYGPMKWLITFKMETYKFAEDVEIKPLIIYSTSDNVIRNESTKNLMTCFHLGCECKELSGLGHGELMSSPEVLNSINDYIQNQEK